MKSRVTKASMALTHNTGMMDVLRMNARVYAWSAPLNSETKLSYKVSYILIEELKGVWGKQ